MSESIPVTADGNTQRLVTNAVASTSTPTALGSQFDAAGYLHIFNTSTTLFVQVKTGTSIAVAATNADYAVGPNRAAIIRKPPGHTHIATITTGTNVPVLVTAVDARQVL
jgi:hypothetical protein